MTITSVFPLLFLVAGLAIVVYVVLYSVDDPSEHIWFKVGEVDE